MAKTPSATPRDLLAPQPRHPTVRAVCWEPAHSGVIFAWREVRNSRISFRLSTDTTLRAPAHVWEARQYLDQAGTGPDIDGTRSLSDVDRMSDLVWTTPHRRRNQLTGEWVLVSPNRDTRPWHGQIEASTGVSRPSHDPQCYLCPGNTRATGKLTPDYLTTYVFDNDFAALVPEQSIAQARLDSLLVAEPEPGICRVVCFTPRHDLSFATMSPVAVGAVIDTWVEQYRELGGLAWVRHVQIFENRGAAMGASNPHPHGQIWANAETPVEPAKEIACQRAYAAANGRCLLCDYLKVELGRGERTVMDNDHFVVLVPFWAVWPYETLVLPRRHGSALTDLSTAQRDDLADILGRMTACYDRLFGVEFAYSMGVHQRPTDGGDYPDVHLHVHYYPPLLRSATIRKFMVGYELLGQPQRDITPETAAARLREVAS